MSTVALTHPLRTILELIDNSPGIVLSGPDRALANKLRKRGLVEVFRHPVDHEHADEVEGYRATLGGRVALGRGLTDELRAKVATEIVALLHAHRDCLRNLGQDTNNVTFDVRDGYYGEAFGILRGLRLLGHANFGACNSAGTLNYWMAELERQVLTEENYGGTNECDYCLKRWGKDGAGRRRA